MSNIKNIKLFISTTKHILNHNLLNKSSYAITKIYKKSAT